MRIVAGVDGGGTRTRVLLAREDGIAIGYGEAGPSNIYHVGESGVQKNIQHAFKLAWKNARLRPQRCDAAFFGLAGIANERERAVIRRIARKLVIAPASKIGVDHDIRIALAGGLAGCEGITLIVGTGSSCYGRRNDGRECKVGGWGYLLDDVGGGVFLGLEALKFFVRVCDGRNGTGGQATSGTLLAAQIRRALKLKNDRDLVRRIYRAQGQRDALTPPEIAKLAPLILNAAKRGNTIAEEIVSRGAEGLAQMAITAARRLEFKNRVAVVLCGGLVETSDFYCQKISREIRRRIKHFNIERPKHKPVTGAVLLSLKMLSTRDS